MSSGDIKKITLRSSDRELFEVTEKAARECETLKHMIEDDCADNIIPGQNVSSKILAKVIEYCKKHVEASSVTPSSSASSSSASASSNDDDLKAFDAEVVNVDNDTLFDLILAANYLNVKKLLDLTTTTVADQIKGKTVEEIRKLFNIVNDFTPKEEEDLRKENAWAFE